MSKPDILDEQIKNQNWLTVLSIFLMMFLAGLFLFYGFFDLDSNDLLLNLGTEFIGALAIAVILAYRWPVFRPSKTNERRSIETLRIILQIGTPLILAVIVIGYGILDVRFQESKTIHAFSINVLTEIAGGLAAFIILEQAIERTSQLVNRRIEELKRLETIPSNNSQLPQNSADLVVQEETLPTDSAPGQEMNGKIDQNAKS